jgi:hypothetical protein
MAQPNRQRSVADEASRASVRGAAPIAVQQGVDDQAGGQPAVPVAIRKADVGPIGK